MTSQTESLGEGDRLVIITTEEWPDEYEEQREMVVGTLDSMLTALPTEEYAEVWRQLAEEEDALSGDRPTKARQVLDKGCNVLLDHYSWWSWQFDGCSVSLRAGTVVGSMSHGRLVVRELQSDARYSLFPGSRLATPMGASTSVTT